MNFNAILEKEILDLSLPDNDGDISQDESIGGLLEKETILQAATFHELTGSGKIKLKCCL